MNADRDAVERLLESVADGIPVDWEHESESDAAPPPRLQALRTIARIAEFSRGLQRASADAPFPERWGSLLLLERLGAGSQADVFRAWDPTLHREIALKLLRADSAAVGDDALLREGRAAAAIRHPNVVTVLGVERHDGRVGLSMELLRGATLEQEVLSNGPLTPEATANLAAGIGAALAAVHAAGFVHRDLKPSNVVHDVEGRFVLADFGLGLRADAARHAGARGTPMYMAPETLEGGAATPRSDVYALGLLLWFALAGRHPFAVATVEARVAAARRGPEPPLRTVRPEVPAGLATAIERALSADPAGRQASARDFVAEIEAAARGGKPRPDPTRGILLVLAAIVVILGAAWMMRRPAARVDVAPPRVATAPSAASYDVSATFQRHTDAGPVALAQGDRVRPGDRLTLEVRASRPMWVYVLNEDERGEQYLLFPQPRFDVTNPVPADSLLALPGTIAGKPNGWTVTSAGGREHFLVVASPEPVAELEADLARLPAVREGAPVNYARVGETSQLRLRGVGGVSEIAPAPAGSTARASNFERYRSLATTERGVTGVWVRHFTLENPR